MTIKALSGLAMGAFACFAMALPMSSNTVELASLNEDATALEQNMLSVEHNYDLSDFDESIGKVSEYQFVVIIKDKDKN